MSHQKNKTRSKLDTVHRKQGFTMVENLLYIAIVSFLLLGLAGLAWNAIEGGTRADLAEELSYNIKFAANSIRYEFKQAEQIINPAPGETANNLTISVDGQEIAFDLNAGRLRMIADGQEPVSVTTEDVTVSDLKFRNVTQPGGTGAVKVNFTIKKTGRLGLSLTREIQTTFNMPFN